MKKQFLLMSLVFFTSVFHAETDKKSENNNNNEIELVIKSNKLKIDEEIKRKIKKNNKKKEDYVKKEYFFSTMSRILYAPWSCSSLCSTLLGIKKLDKGEPITTFDKKIFLGCILCTSLFWACRKLNSHFIDKKEDVIDKINALKRNLENNSPEKIKAREKEE